MRVADTQETRRLNRSRRPWATALIVGVAVVVQAIPGATSALEYDRAAVSEGQIWLPLTAQAVHWSPAMAAVDLAVVIIAGLLIEARSKKRLLGALGVAAVVVGLAVHFLASDIVRYRGASGIAIALVVVAALDIFGDGSPRARLLVGIFLALLADFVVRPSQFQGLGIPAINPESAFERRLGLADRGIPQPSYRNIVGGVDALVRVMVREIESRGGRISCGSEVKRIRIEQNRVTGVELEDGTVEPADLVIASGGAKELFFELVGKSSLPDDFVRKIDDTPLMESVFMVHLGVDFDPLQYQKIPVCYYFRTYDIEKGVEEVQSGHYTEGADGFVIYVPSVNSPDMAPEGHNAVTVYTIAPDTLDEGTWAEKKEEYAEKLLDHAERVLPGLSRSHHRSLDGGSPCISPQGPQNDWRG